jgi:hypothetical protein
MKLVTPVIKNVHASQALLKKKLGMPVIRLDGMNEVMKNMG